MAAPDRTHYDVLGIARDADAAAIRAAWKLHVQVWHPDRFNGEMREKAEQQASRINEAYTTLRDGSRRAAYDCRLAADEAAAAPAEQRPETPAKRAARVPQGTQQRAAATPIGTPMAHVAPPPTISDQLTEMYRDTATVLRAHPRLTTAAVAAVVFVFGGSMLMHAIAGPSLPSGSTITAQAAADTGPAARLADEQVDDLAQLTEQARVETKLAEAEMQQLLREDALAAEAEATAAARQAAPATPGRGRNSIDPRAGAQLAPRTPAPNDSVTAPRQQRATAPHQGRPPAGGRIVRVMPSTV